MSSNCSHLDHVHAVGSLPSGCEDCLAAGRHDWVHLRVCQECSHVGCCDQSPGRHATQHFSQIRPSGHPVIRTRRRLVLVLRRRICIRARRSAARPFASLDACCHVHVRLRHATRDTRGCAWWIRARRRRRTGYAISSVGTAASTSGSTYPTRRECALCSEAQRSTHDRSPSAFSPTAVNFLPQRSSRSLPASGWSQDPHVRNTT